MTDASTTGFETGKVVGDIGRILRAVWQPMLPAIVGLVFLPQLVVAALSAASAGGSPDILGLLAIAALAAGLIGFAGAIAMTLASLDVLSGESETSKGLIARAGKLYLPAFWTSFLVGLGILGGSLLFVIPGFFLAIAWYVALPVRLVEHLKAT